MKQFPVSSFQLPVGPQLGAAIRGAILVLVLAPTIAAAQVMNDPTRPPAGFAAEAPEGAVAGNQLQSVVISPVRRAAIINGVVVELGQKYGDAVLTRVAEDEVVLGSGDSRQVLKLHPAVEKVGIARAEPVAPAAAKSPPRKAKPKRKTTPKAKAKPKAQSQSGANAAADSNARTR